MMQHQCWKLDDSQTMLLISHSLSLLSCQHVFSSSWTSFQVFFFQSFQLILHVLIDSRCNDALTHQLFYHLCQSFHLLSEHQLIVSTFIELIKYLQLVQFLVYILRLDWILLRDSDIYLSLTCWCCINDAHHLFLTIRMKRKHHVNDVLLSKKIDV